MAGALRKTMLYLGLSEADRERDEIDDDRGEDRYDDAEPQGYDDYDDEPPAAEVTPITRASSRLAEQGHLRRITTVHPRTYNDAKLIGESFRGGTPVIMNLTDMSDADAKRLVDFSAGLVFGLRGAIERVTNKVFLLSPASVEIASERSEPEASQTRFFDQS
jgi:cell division inhibitor SepF